MSHAVDMSEDEISQKTAIAIDAQHTAYGAQMTSRRAVRIVSRFNWVWGVLLTMGAIGAIGYGLRDRETHFAQKEQVDANTAEIERQRAQILELNATLRGVVDTQKRTLDGVDDVKRILMNRSRR